MGYNFGTEEPAITVVTGKSVAEQFVPSAEAALLRLQIQRLSQGGDSSEIMADK